MSKYINLWANKSNLQSEQDKFGNTLQPLFYMSIKEEQGFDGESRVVVNIRKKTKPDGKSYNEGYIDLSKILPEIIAYLKDSGFTVIKAGNAELVEDVFAEDVTISPEDLPF